jgi:hypothetical protein
MEDTKPRSCNRTRSLAKCCKGFGLGFSDAPGFPIHPFLARECATKTGSRQPHSTTLARRRMPSVFVWICVHSWFHLSKALLRHFSSMPTGQWSEPVTSGRMNALVSFFRRRAEARK